MCLIYRSRVLGLVFALFSGIAVDSMVAQPTGGQVAAGAATFAGGPGGLTITQTSGRAVINWQDFSIAAGQVARFVQPDATSATLNRVISDLPSTILGNLEANGRVFLINPNGILIGAGARIDTGGFLASTLDVANQDFLAGGDLHFSGDSAAAVRNLGAINALGGDVFLIARRVENTGTITAAGGTVGLAAGSEVLLTTGGSERVFVQAGSAPGTLANAGTLTAATAELKAAGGNAYALAINNSGTVRATGSELRNGQVWLVATGDSTVETSGVIDVSSATGRGGKVAITGGRVLLAEGAHIDASGAKGGGEILVFGGAQAGGQVAVGGTLAAGSTHGDGGFIETSAARVTVTDAARVTTLAPNGRNGTWLIDPVDFTIAASGGDMTGAAVGTALAGGNFTIQSTTGGTGTAGAVNVNNAISWSANRLTLNAQNNINFNAVMNASGTASLALEYGQGAVAAGNSSNYLVNAAINLPAGANFSTKLGSDGTVKNFTVITALGAAGSTTATDLQGMAGNLAGLYVLGADIDATATSGWNATAGFAPIGTTAARYTGTFDGLGHTVSGLTIARPAQNDVGLIGYLGVGGVLKNIRLTGGSITGQTGVGALLGSNSGSVSYASASTLVSGLKNVGGLVGASVGPIANVWATGNVSNVVGGTGFVGGLVGNSATGGSITNGWASGNVTATGPNAGGLVGFNSTSVISNTYATGAVSGTGFVGGLVGSVFGNINNSYATGAVTGSSSRVGGLAGHIYSGMTVSNSYATGSVAGSSLVGGFTGSSDGTVINSYWNSTVTAIGMGSGTGATGRTAAEMKALASFTGFDISADGGSSAVWRIYEGNTTPWLRVFLTPLTVTASSDSKTYNGVAYSGGNGVTYSVTPNPAVSGTLVFGGTAQGAINVGSYTLIPSGLYSTQQGNDIIYANGALTVNRANLTVTGSQIYNGTTAFAGANLIANGVNGQTFTVTGAGATGNLASKDVQTGTALANTSGLALGTSLNGGIVNNYNPFFQATFTVSVTPANLILSGTQVYNGLTAFAGGNLTATGVNGETFTMTGAGATGNLSTKNVQTGQLLAGVAGLIVGTGNTGAALATNYNLTTANSSVSVTPRPLTITGFASNDKTYDGLTTAVIATSGTLTGVVSGDNVAFTNTGATFDTKNVGSGKTVTLGGVALTGGDQTNYTYTAVTTDLSTITAATLTYTATPATRLYGANNPAFTGTVTGFVNGETLLGATTGTTAFTSTATPANNVGIYGILGSGLTANNGNYVFVQAAGNATAFSITPAPLTITADNKTKVYGAALPTFTATYAGLVNGDTLSVVTGLTLTTTATAASNVGTSAITAANGTAANYTITHAPGALTITPAPLTIAAADKSKVYGAALPTFTASYTGLVNGDASSVVTGLTLTPTATAASNVGTSTITAANGTAANYTITHAPGTLTITPAPLTITADNKSRTVGAADPAFTATYAGLVNNDTTAAITGLTLATSALTGSPVGNYAISPSGATAANYTLTFVNGTLAVTSQSLNLLTITADNKTKIYGAALPTFTASYAGLLNGDTSSVVAGLQFGTTASASANVGTYAITPFGGTAAGYTLAYVSGLLTINPAALTITANNATRTYGAVNPAFGANFAGLVNGDASSVVTGLTLTPTATAASNVGTSTITAANGTAANYTITHAPGTLTITPAPLTITADNKTKVYGAALPTFTASYTGLVNGDTLSVVSGLTLTTTATAASGVGASAITAANGTASNYTITHAPGALSITPAPLTITADNKSRAFGAANPLFTATYTGLVNNDTLAAVSGLTFGTTALTSSPVGSYLINTSGATAANYTINFVPGLLSIGQNLLTITADNKTKIYGAALPTFTASYAGFMNGDTSSVVTGLQFSATASASANVGTYTITPFGGIAASYTLAYVSGLLTINPAALTITANNATRTYGAVNPAFGANFAGLVNGDTSSVVTGLAFGTPATTASNVGSYAITPVNGVAANYTITSVPGALNVTPAPLTIAADNKSRAFGVANPTLTASYTGFVNGETSSVVTGLSLATTALTSSPGGNYPITASGATAANYALTFAPGTLAISQQSLTLLTITADNLNKIYGATLPVFTASYAGLLNGDTSSVVTGLQFSTTASAGANVGTYTITPFGGSAASYTLAYVSGLLTINPAALTITANSATRIYGAANPAFGATFAGLVNGDTSSVVTGLAFTTPATSATGIGSYAITPSGASAPNYALTFVPGTLTINRASLTLTANNASRDFGDPNPPFTGTFAGLVNGDTATVVSGLAFNTPATTTSAAGDYAITPSGATAANYSFTFVNGILRVIAPTVIVGPAPVPVVTVNSRPAITTELAVVNLDGRLTLVPINPPEGTRVSLDGQLALTLSEVTGLPNFLSSPNRLGNSRPGGAPRTGGPNFGNFELVSARTGGGGGTGAIQLNEPGVFRESTINMGGFNVVYHEADADARRQTASNTALGSSYREFSDDENPQINHVRAKMDRKPADSAAGRGTGGTQ